MAKSNLMDRVAHDLAKGHTHPAKQRLHSLIAAHPTDLDLRRQLADVYRQTGDIAEAGRWSYLDEAADPFELLAFERTYPSPSGRRAALRWPADALPPTDYVRRKLAELPLPPTARARAAAKAKASAATERAVATAQRVRVTFRLTWGRLAAVSVLCGLALVGLYAIVDWIF
ncbi:MAG TPA: DUF6584 family protein [Candidatus Limnocylindrales bacterium]